MGRKTRIAAALNNTRLPNCCVTNSFKSINLAPHDLRLSTWGQFGNAKFKATAVDPGHLKDPVAYLQLGASLVKDAEWAGVCQTFACASASVINKDVQGVTSIELFSFGTSFSGHVYLVIDRPQNSDPADPSTWAGSLVVDLWYAIQKTTPNAAVYSPNSAYYAWLQNQLKIKCVLKVV